MKNLSFLLLSFATLCGSLKGEIDYFPADDVDLKEYLNQMPWQHYATYNVYQLGSFWVDNAKDCVKTTIRSEKFWEPHIVENYIKPGDRVIDIGGHLGTITMAMSNIVGPKGMVYTFEQERQFFRELVENIKLNNKENIKPHLAWISDENKTVEATWFYGPEYSPVHEANEKPYSLKVRTLDSFGYKNIALIKIDVDCTEDKVLDGAKATIMESRPVLVIKIMRGFGKNPSPEVKKRIAHTIAKLNVLSYRVSKINIDDYLAIPMER